MQTPATSPILLIEDDPAVCRATAAYLEDCDYAVITTPDGNEGVELFRRHHPSLVLIDLHIQGIDGLDVLKIVRDAAPETPAIVISGSGTMHDVVHALRFGAWDYLYKPMSEMAILRYAVERSLERSRLMRENREHQQNLHRLVQERTAQLEEANAALASKNLALREVLTSVQDEKAEVGRSVVSNVEKVVLPMLSRLRSRLPAEERRQLDQIEEELRTVVSPFIDKLANDASRLSPMELRVASHIRRGLSAKEIASLEHISPETVATHRRAIRKKLGITNLKVNLESYLEVNFSGGPG